MNTPLSWIKAYVPELTCTEQEYMDKLDDFVRRRTNIVKQMNNQAALNRQFREAANTRMRINWLSARWQLTRKEQQRRL